jgi:hypothetical protein
VNDGRIAEINSCVGLAHNSSGSGDVSRGVTEEQVEKMGDGGNSRERMTVVMAIDDVLEELRRSS